MSGVGSFTFRWAHPGEEVFVTGTFDDWGKTVRLEKYGTSFSKTVDTLPLGEKIYYKFVVDGNWTTDHTAPSEHDGQYNTNNVLLPEDIKPSTSHTVFGIVVHPSTEESDIPGAFPETPGNELQSFNTGPMVASSTMRDSASPRDQSVPQSSTSADENSQEQQTFGVAPIPASSGTGNRIHLAPGEAVPDPSKFTDNTVESTVRTDRASYERSDAAPQLPPVVTPEGERATAGGMFGLPEAQSNLIPESSLPMGNDAGNAEETNPGYNIQSAGPKSTTAELAGQVPRESRGVPEVIEDNPTDSEMRSPSRTMAGREALEQQPTLESATTGQADTDARAGPSLLTGPMVHEDSTDQDRMSKATESSSDAKGTSRDSPGTTNEGPSSIGIGGIASMAATGLAAAGSAVAAAASATKEKALEATGYVQSNPPSTEGRRAVSGDVQRAIDEINARQGGPATSGLPEPVVRSLQQFHESPEAAANPEAVSEKEAMERELLSTIRSGDKGDQESQTASATDTVPAVVAQSIRRAHESPEAATNPEAVAEKEAVERELLNKIKSANADGQPGSHEMATGRVPTVVAESIRRAHESPEAATNPEAVAEKEAVEGELLNKVRSADAERQPGATASATDGVPAVVAESIRRAHESPEAATNPEAVAEKEAVEGELLSKVRARDTTGQLAPTEVLPGTVPPVVAKSIQRFHESPEAATNPEAVAEKGVVESELLSKVRSTDAEGEPAPGDRESTAVPRAVTESIHRAHVSPEATANPEAVAEKQAVENELLHKGIRDHARGEHAPSAADTNSVPDPHVPQIVAKSIEQSHQSPEAASNPEAVSEKTAVERELLSSVEPTDEAGEPGPTLTAATSAVAPLPITLGIEAFTPAGPEPVADSAIPSGTTTSTPGPSMRTVQQLLSSGSFPKASAGTDSWYPAESSSMAPLAGSLLSGSAAPREVLDHPGSTGETWVPSSAGTFPVTPTDAPAYTGDGLAGSTVAGNDGLLGTSAAPTSSTTMGLNAPGEAPAQSAATRVGLLDQPPPPSGKGKDVSWDVSPSASVPPTTTQTSPQVTTGVAESSIPQISQAPPSSDTITPSRSTTAAISPGMSPSSSQRMSEPAITPQKTAAQLAASSAAASSSKTPQSSGGRSVSGTPASVKTNLSSSSAGGASTGQDGERKKKRHSFFGKLKEKLRGDRD